jgi:SAM-dependent methyltransferase
MEETARARGQRLARESLARGDTTGWFETLYAQAQGDPRAIQWAAMAVNPNLAAWLERTGLRGEGKWALVVGCGLGDDAETLARLGFAVEAFDVAPTAIDWCHARFPASPVHYVVADLLAAPANWLQAFDFVLEAYTLQVLPADVRPRAVEHIADSVAPGGTLLVICRGRDPEDAAGAMPWPLTRGDLDLFRAAELREICFEDYVERDESPTRRFRVEYRRPL